VCVRVCVRVDVCVCTCASSMLTVVCTKECKIWLTKRHVPVTCSSSNRSSSSERVHPIRGESLSGNRRKGKERTRARARASERQSARACTHVYVYKSERGVAAQAAVQQERHNVCPHYGHDSIQDIALLHPRLFETLQLITASSFYSRHSAVASSHYVLK